MSDKATILDTPLQLELFHLLQIKYALKIEIRTGMRHSKGSVLGLANKVMDTSYRDKQQALDALDALIAEKEKPLLEDPA